MKQIKSLINKIKIHFSRKDLSRVFPPHNPQWIELRYESDPVFAHFILILDDILIDDFHLTEPQINELHDKLAKRLSARTYKDR